jgi:hypothetical protein
MITKILFTALVILAALIFIRHKNSQTRQQSLAREAQQASERRTAMLIATALVVLTLVVSGAIYYWHWQQDHRIVNVSVVNSHSGAIQRYQVYQAEMQGRRFRTIDGVEIHLSDAERLEVQTTE